MDCKKALAASGNDMNQAMDWLRKKGIARASNNADRLALEGLVGIHKSTLIEVNSETDFVSRNKDFQQFVALVASTAHAIGVEQAKSSSSSASLDVLAAVNAALKEQLLHQINTIRENIIIRRATHFLPGPSQALATYVHGRVGLDVDPNVQMGKVAALVRLSFSHPLTQQQQVDDIGRRLAMHIVAAQPAYLNEAQVPSEVREREVAIAREQQQQQDAGKPKKPEVVEKIIQGKVNKRLGEICLTSQAHVAEEGQPLVGLFLSKSQLQLVDYERWALGGASSTPPP